MWYWTAALIILLSALCFFTRIYWKLKYPFFGNDTWAHLGTAREIRKNRFRAPATSGIHYTDGPWDYPPLLPYLVAAFSEKRALAASRYIPAVFDTLSCAATGAFLALLPPIYYPWPPDPGIVGVAVPANLLLPMLGMLVWIFTPMTAIDTFQHLSPRPIANFWMLLTVMLMFLYFRNPAWPLLALMLVPVTLIYLTHKFTLQALTFLNIGVAVYLRQPWFLVVQALGFLAAVAFSGGYYLRVIRGHLSFVNYYRKNGARKYPGKYAIDRERLMKILKLDATGNPWIFFIIPILWMGGWPLDILTVMALTMVVAYLLVSLNPLLFLGEPERYFETATFPLAVVIPVFMASTAPGSWKYPGWALFILMLLVGMARIYREMKGREEQMFDKTRVVEHYVDPAWLEACEFMKEQAGQRVLTVPEYSQWATYYFTGKQVQGSESACRYSQYMEEFPATPSSLRGLVLKYRVDLVLLARAASQGYDLSFAKRVFENERYLVYDVSGMAAEARREGGNGAPGGQRLP
jgi:hypothetical protein